MAVDLDAGAVHPLDPAVEIGLGEDDIAVVGRFDALIRRAHRHRALRERAVAGVLRGRAEPDPLVAETAGDAVRDHALEHVLHRLVAHPVAQIAARAHLLQRQEIAALVMHAGQAVAHELLGDEGERIAVAPPRLFRGMGWAHAHLGEHQAGAVGHAPIKLALGVAVERAGRRAWRVPGDAGECEGLAIVKGRVAAAMAHRDRVFGRHLVK